MKRKRFTEEQIIEVLWLHAAGAKASELCRQHGISKATLYNWRAKYGGMTISDARRLRQLEDKNRKLKKLLAEAMLDNTALKDLASGNVWSAPGAQISPWNAETNPRDRLFRSLIYFPERKGAADDSGYNSGCIHSSLLAPLPRGISFVALQS